MQRWKENQPAVAVTPLDILDLRYYTASSTVRGGTLLLHGVFKHFGIPLRACLYDPGQAVRDAYRDPARNTNSNECLYDTAIYPA